MSETWAKTISMASLAFLLILGAFAGGWFVHSSRAWPYESLRAAGKVAKSYLEFGAVVPEGRLVRRVAGRPSQRYVVHDAGALAGGQYVFVGFNSRSGGYEAWLYRGGELIHTWPLDYGALDPKWSGQDEVNPHGVVVLADGSLVVNFDKGDWMARFDACGKPAWSVRGAYHHSVALGDDGSVWTWRGKGGAYGPYQVIASLDAESGRTLREIGLVEDVIRKAGSQSLVFRVRPDHAFDKPGKGGHDGGGQDIFHPNDVEVLRAQMAPAFPEFAAGDLLVSVREANLVAVLDGSDYHVKWSRSGPWFSQHDPDFDADGRISVYDNNLGRGRSEILYVQPSTGEVANPMYGGEARFYSPYMGTHQRLPNGNVLVVVPDEGRIFEATVDGRYVMEFNNVSVQASGYNDHVENAVWLPDDYFKTTPACRRPGP